MKAKYFISFILLIAIIIPTYSLASQANQLKFCHEDENAFPWVFSENNQTKGLDIRLIRLVEKEIDIPIQLISLPWKRCLEFMKTNQVDGAFAASFKQERLTMGVYPVNKRAELAKEKRIHMSSYSLYLPLKSKLEWNGYNFKNLKGKISAQLGFSIIDKLTMLGASVREVKGPERALRDILSKRSIGAAIQTERANYFLNNSSTLKNHIKQHAIALVEKPYYLMLSFKLTKNHPELSTLIWNMVEKVRNSHEMETLSIDFWETMKHKF